MRKLLLFLFCVLAKTSYAQVVVDPDVVNSYNKAVKKLPAEYKHFAENKGIGSGFTIFTVYDIDTLNKKDKIHYNGYVQIGDIDNDRTTGKTSYHKVSKTWDEDINTPVPCIALLKGDILIVEPFTDLYPQIIHKIVKKKVISQYDEYRKRDTVLRLSLSQPKTTQISVSTKTTEFKLSTLNFKPGQIIYGEVDFITDPYYVDDSGFTSGYIRKRLHGKYVFKATITVAKKYIVGK